MADDLIGDRYVLGPLLGRGGMAEVRRAHDTRLDRDVAVKRLRADLAGDPVFQERFRREAQSAAGLNHPNIVSVFDTGESWDAVAGVMIPYIVMELVVGHTLREILHDGRKIQPVRALEMTQSVLEALDYSHRNGIIHRDIKPANVMLTSAGQVKVMDFGIARAVSDTAASMTQTASVIGTPQYLSPEQIRGDQVDRRSDIYATGCLLYELLTGRPPFEGDSPVSLAYQHVRANPIPPSEIDPLVSTQMDAITLKALAKSPSDRYQSAHDMADDIGRLLSGQKVHAQVPPPASEDDIKTQVIASPSTTQVMSTRPARASRAIEEPPEEEERSAVGKIVGIVLACILVIALITVGIVWHYTTRDVVTPPPTDSSTSLVTVPNLTGFTEDNARKTLEENNLVADVRHENGKADDTVDRVIKQLPESGEKIATGGTVIITINDGPEEIVMPSVLGMNKDEAKAKLEETFKNVTLAEAPSEGANDKVDTIVSTDPVAGTSITADTKITLYYATGQATVPNVVGRSLTEAIRILVQAGFSANPTLVYKESTQPENSVIEQSPSPDTKVPKDTPIVLTIAEKPAAPPTQPVDPPTNPSSTDNPSAPNT
ncbi:MAG: Stk1 family PASTA domain-containing Ser/Thr kinase [Propionibacteriaceae bacterium]|jgi:serine/threonine-protein kinase|nr:Stk1 family PASTA domain-containing Ser/Thr kinase [Propionibacteriaceae bacterium]